MSREGAVSQRPHEGFVALGNEIRVEILSVLVAHERSDPDQLEVGFADLRTRTGIDDPSKFNYHLKQLRGRFLEKTEDGYRLTNAGRRVVSAIWSGAFTQVSNRQTIATGIDCPKCRSPLTACYETDSFHVSCPTHGNIGRLPLPPGVATNRPIDDMYRIASMCGSWYTEAARHGACPICWGRTEVTVPVEGTPNFSNASSYAHIDDQPLAHFSCTDCWLSLYVPIGGCVIDHPAVVSFFFANGVAIREQTFFEIEFIWSEDVVTRISDDPIRIQIDISIEDERLVLVLDEQTTVVDYAFAGQ